VLPSTSRKHREEEVIKKIIFLPLLPDIQMNIKRGADKSLARLGKKQATATEDFDFHISYL
jgi:hypothetical protein